MRVLQSILFLVAVVVFAVRGGFVEEDDEYMEFLEKVFGLHRKIHSDPDLSQAWDNHVARWNTRDAGPVMPPPVFECDTSIGEGEDPPDSVHKLRPRDINVISAFGDSITAGNGLGARNVIEVAFENRGESWAVGGDERLEENVVTLTNIIRKFNPDIKGYSICMTGSEHQRSWLNVARPGGTNRNLPGQADVLIERLKNDSRIDFQNDWKMTTMFVGGNDLCDSCNRWDRYAPSVYRSNFELAIDKLYEQVPRMFVNVVVMFDITPLPEFSSGPDHDLLCELLQWGFCDCVKNESTVDALRGIQMAYYEELQAMVDSGRYDGREDFAVVLQPHMRDMLPPVDPETGEYVREFLSYDCFHPSRLAHQSLTYFLWDTMLIPVGHKPFETDDGLDNSVVTCPTQEHPYLFTKENSKDVEWPPANMAARRHRGKVNANRSYTPKNSKKWRKMKANDIKKKASTQ